MCNTISSEVIEAKNYAIENLGLRFPISSGVFLKERARILKENHPDKVTEEVETEKFLKIYTTLNIIKTNLDIMNGYTKEKDRTQQGDLLINLGRGFEDRTKNTVKCSNCDGKGYYAGKNAIFGIKENFCDCEDGFIKTAPCKHCAGTGKFKTRSGKIVDCKSCDGSGIHVFKNPMVCPKCRNKRYRLFGLLFGFETIVGYEDIFHTCAHCRGRGEIEIHNPVITRNAVSGNKSRSERPTTLIVGNGNTVARLNKLMRSMR